jgi:hypothetical protein
MSMHIESLNDPADPLAPVLAPVLDPVPALVEEAINPQAAPMLQAVGSLPWRFS